MITLTKEWLLTTIAELEEERDATPGAVNEDAAKALAAMKLALASLEAESKPRQPELSHVIYHFRDWNEGFPIERFKADYVISWMLANYPPAQPTAVSVPDAISTRQAIAKMENHELCDSINVAYKFGWNACRAAMLQGADGNAPAHFRSRPAQSSLSPAQGGNSPVIPDGWVACSERMPEGMTDVHISNGHDVGQGWWDGETWQTQHDYYSVPGDVTHWMPLPAAPQQEVK
ncbi:DUF551 domain-containing protein [Enterobacter hormaechei]